MSHPTWVRGLKHAEDTSDEDGRWVAPYVGAWIETFRERKRRMQQAVAPYVGAWIETPRWHKYRGSSWSHPTWVRGLKQTQMRR